MRPGNIGGFKRVKGYVDHKMGLLEHSDRSMSALYGLMFSERENVLFKEMFGIEFGDDRLFLTVGDVVDFIEENMK